MKYLFLLLIIATLSCGTTIMAQDAGSDIPKISFDQIRVAENIYEKELIFSENFNFQPKIWVEGNLLDVKVKNGALLINANSADSNGVTVFIDQKFNGALLYEYEAVVLESDTAFLPLPVSQRDVNNVNTFLYYSKPSGEDLKTTREMRMDGRYSHYHSLNGYIITHLNGYPAELRKQAQNPYYVPAVNENTARTRMRQCPGFKLKSAIFRNSLVQKQIYKLQFLYLQGKVYFFRNNKLVLSFQPDKAYRKGYFGFRTWKTKMAIDNFKVWRVSSR